jgi:6-pyruvoyltetrahydropterin/6-carboxytetrahydropterin synthase
MGREAKPRGLAARGTRTLSADYQPFDRLLSRVPTACPRGAPAARARRHGRAPAASPASRNLALRERRKWVRLDVAARVLHCLAAVKVRLIREQRFEAAHRLPKVPAGHKCARLHGHSFKIELVVAGPVDPETGWFIDYGELDALWQPLHDQLDHNYLNDIQGLDNPTSENLAHWLWNKLRPQLPALERIIVHETCDARCEYEGD